MGSDPADAKNDTEKSGYMKRSLDWGSTSAS